jgi:multiple RNA-binding domain-containing protein 1
MECQISDPTLMKHQEHPRSTEASAKRKSPEKSADDGAVSKKRKLDEQGRPDPKLREFLKVMGTSKEGVLEDATAAGEGYFQEDIPQVAVPEGESDDEYERIPSRKEVRKKAESPPRPNSTEKLPQGDDVLRIGKEEQLVDDPPDSSGTGDQEEADATGAKDAGQEAAADDDDWLRSRTNRLLDLMDPEDLPVQAKGEPINKPQPDQDTGEHQTEETLETQAETSNDTATDSMDVDDEPAGSNTEDAIRRTSRLFVRNLPYGATEDDVRKKFETFGTLQEVSEKICV